MYTTIDGQAFKNMLVGAYQMFEKKYEIINRLNVFPVPDGDTGSNMLNTLRSMYSMIAEEDGSENIGILAEKAATGAIMGARGNSGVILSQIIHGLSRGLRGKRTASCSQMGKAFQYGILYAYRAVSQPVEGTILSVARGLARGTREVVRTESDFSRVLEACIAAGEEALALTPEQLPILKQANVVDAGGQGLVYFLVGCLNGLTGKNEDIEVENVTPLFSKMEAKGEAFSIEFPYCTQFVLSPCKLKGKEIRKRLNAWGESMVIAEGDNLVRVHIHSQRPGHVLDMAADWGTLHDIKCDNMIDQFEQNKEQQETVSKKPLGILSVVSGDGWMDIFQNLGADVLSGGQTMNPSVQELSDVIKHGHYEKYIILPNNKNIILAAKQIKKLMGETITIVPSTNAMEGLAAAMAFCAEKTGEENEAAMTEALATVTTGQVTTAVRDTTIGNVVIHTNDYLGISRGHDIIATPDFKDCAKWLLAEIVTEETEVVSLYYGEGLTREAAEALVEELADIAPDAEFEIYEGGQPLYPLYLSAE